MSEHLDTMPAEVPASSGGSAAELPRTALLYADESLLPHVEQTLAALRIPVVYRAAIAQDHSALAGARPEIALINLDDRCGEELDPLTAMLDTAGVPIVFNDADISNRLEGWARARWARHLIAKLCGRDDVDPPRPTRPDAIAPAPAGALTEAPPAAAIEAAPAPVAENGHPEPAATEPAAASRPLSQNEIDALVVDFPSTEAAAAGEDTEAWSAQIDALLADAPDSASREPAPWEVVGFAEDAPGQQPAAVAEPKPDTAAVAPAAASSAKPALAASADQWQLVDDFTPVAPAAKPAAPELSTNFGSGLALELEPLDPTESGR